ncbi:MAG: dipeptidase [Melioribacteraceae bacterium]|nr:dipeptidase [Melioribacteraceae bacterium]
MKNYSISLLVLLSFIIFTSCKSKNQNITHNLDSLQVHSSALTIDTHMDIPIELVVNPDYNLGEEHNPYKSGTKVDFPRMKKGGLDVGFFIVWTAQGKTDSKGYKKVREKADNILDVVKKNENKSPSVAELAYSTDDINRITDLDKRAILIGMENGYPLGEDLTLVQKYYDDGIRYITLCHTRDNQLCSSSTDDNEDKGLSKFGSDVVNEMNKAGIIIDVSHVSDKAFYDILKLTKTPVIASHSNARSLCDHPRNMSDDMLKALANNGGVIHVNFVNSYLKSQEENPQRDSAFAELRNNFDFENMENEERGKFHKEMKRLSKEFPSDKATLKDVVDHIDYIVKLIGIDHVGIGSDFDGGGGLKGVFDSSEMGNITTELIKRGYSEKDIKKIWGDNFMRVFREVENYSKNNG